jgi:hypothetical protein
MMQKIFFIHAVAYFSQPSITFLMGYSTQNFTPVCFRATRRTHSVWIMLRVSLSKVN